MWLLTSTLAVEQETTYYFTNKINQQYEIIIISFIPDCFIIIKISFTSNDFCGKYRSSQIQCYNIYSSAYGE